MPEPIVVAQGNEGKGSTLYVGEWGGTHVGEVGPLHVHHSDDEAWHVIEGRLRFRYADGDQIAEAGTTVFVPAGVAHTFGNPGPDAVRYLIITTARLNEMISKLHEVDASEQEAIWAAYDSQRLE